MKTLIAVFAVVALAGCAGGSVFASRAGAPAPLIGDDKEVVWIVRPVQVAGVSPGGMKTLDTFYGLYACYRQPVASPGAPTCYLAKFSGDLKGLTYPGAVMLSGSELVPVQAAGVK